MPMRSHRSNRRCLFLPSASLVGIAAALAATTGASDASALQVFGSDCNFGFQHVYNPGDAVCVSGELDVGRPGQVWREG